MKGFLVVAAVLLMGASMLGVAGCTAKNALPGKAAPGAQLEQPAAQAEEEDIVRELVKDFGQRLQRVSLSASPEAVRQSIQESYGDYITPALLDRWLSDPQKAPGRTVSSPWPDRIDISSLTKVTESLSEVRGRIVEITSVEKETGGSAATRPVTLMVKKENDRWRIDNVTTGAEVVSRAVGYRNTQYGLQFSLPDSWRGYSIVTDQWVGNAIGDDRIVETGPLLSIRHPNWTAQNPRQDIPIMVFTTAQWTALQQGEFHIGAAPVGPSELGRNRAYVFALPARYNYAFPAGFEEVEAILSSKPLTPLE